MAFIAWTAPSGIGGPGPLVQRERLPVPGERVTEASVQAVDAAETDQRPRLAVALAEPLEAFAGLGDPGEGLGPAAAREQLVGPFVQHPAGQGLAGRVDDGERFVADRGVIVAVGHRVDRHFGGVDQAVRVVQLLEGRHRRSRQGHRLSRLALACGGPGPAPSCSGPRGVRSPAVAYSVRARCSSSIARAYCCAIRVGGGQLPPRLPFDARLPLGLGARRDGLQQAHGAIAFAGQEGGRGVARQRGEMRRERTCCADARPAAARSPERGRRGAAASTGPTTAAAATVRTKGGRSRAPSRPSLLAGSNSRAHRRREWRATR